MKTIIRYSLTVIALVLVTSFANAQYLANNATAVGDGDNPYVGTAYTYNVTRGNAGSTIEWLVYDNATDYANSPASVSDATNYTITGGATTSATITWNNPGTYYLTYKETLNGCSTFRGIVVIATANSFQINLIADASACNVQNNKVLDWEGYNEPGEEVITPLAFEVQMTKDAGFSIDSWQFNGSFAVPTGISPSSITASEGTINVSGNTFTLTGLTSGSVTITFGASGLITAGGDITLTASAGKAISGAITTNDNGTGDLDQKITLNPLPGASNISF